MTLTPPAALATLRPGEAVLTGGAHIWRRCEGTVPAGGADWNGEASVLAKRGGVGGDRIWLLAGGVAIVLGFVLLAAGDVTAAPLLLVGGYCVCVPLYLYRVFRRGMGGTGE